MAVPHGGASEVTAERLMEVVRLLPDVLFICHKGPDGKIYWSLNEGGLAEQFGLTTEKIRGKSLDELFPGGASDALHEHFEAAFRGEITVFTNEIEGRHFRHFPQPILDEDGNVVEVAGFIADVTDLVKAERRLQELNGELDAFTHAVSHELRTPITALNTWVQVLLRAPDLAAARVSAARMVRTVDRMKTLVDGLLNLSRAGHAALRWSRVDVPKLATDIWGELDPPRARLIMRGDSTLHADATFVRIALENLLSNALKYRSEARDLRLVVHVEGSTLTVEDNGNGFTEPPESLFAVFSRGQHSQERGYGVGLSTVRRIVERHGGSISAESTPGQGATFRLDFGSP